MGPVARIALLVVLGGLAGLAAADPAAERFGGRYGHGASEPAFEPVWEVRRAGEGWQTGTLADGEFAQAYTLSPAGRDAFWDKMGWPLPTAADAHCVSWGQAPGGLMDLLADAPAASPPDTFGYALICHVPAASRQAIDSLADESEDWFYYDPMAGIMGVRRLP
jgi:hypothetical protein